MVPFRVWQKPKPSAKPEAGGGGRRLRSRATGRWPVVSSYGGGAFGYAVGRACTVLHGAGAVV
jgi:hypothetical protein